MKRFSLIMIAVVSAFALALCSCTKTDPKEIDPYSDVQKQIFAMMHGTFEYDIYGVVTTITFGEHYSKPVEATFDDGKKTEVHGTLTIKYWNGDSYTRYYRLHYDGKGITFYNKKDAISLTYLHDFQYVDDNTFRIKETKATLWDTYKRK